MESSRAGTVEQFIALALHHHSNTLSMEGTTRGLPGGTLNGTVAARSVNVQEGGEMLGKFRIRSGAP
jgi:hypothetical protein